MVITYFVLCRKHCLERRISITRSGQRYLALSMLIPKFFLPHIEQRYKGNVEIKQYCIEMDTNGIWGTDIELFAVATMLQAPIYTYTQFHDSREYRWSRYYSLAQPSQVVCDYVPSIRKLVHMTKLPNYHLDLLHLNGNHYDLIVSNQEDSNWLNCPLLSEFTCNIIC